MWSRSQSRASLVQLGWTQVRSRRMTSSRIHFRVVVVDRVGAGQVEHGLEGQPARILSQLWIVATVNGTEPLDEPRPLSSGDRCSYTLVFDVAPAPSAMSPSASTLRCSSEGLHFRRLGRVEPLVRCLVDEVVELGQRRGWSPITSSRDVPAQTGLEWFSRRTPHASLATSSAAACSSASKRAAASLTSRSIRARPAVSATGATLRVDVRRRLEALAESQVRDLPGAPGREPQLLHRLARHRPRAAPSSASRIRELAPVGLPGPDLRLLGQLQHELIGHAGHDDWRSRALHLDQVNPALDPSSTWSEMAGSDRGGGVTARPLCSATQSRIRAGFLPNY